MDKHSAEALIQESVPIIQQMQDYLAECLQSYAMPENAQDEIRRILTDATMFRRKAEQRHIRQMSHSSTSRRHE